MKVPVAEYEITSPLQALIDRGVEVRFTDRLWEAAEEVKASTLNWSLCRMGYAQPQQEKEQLSQSEEALRF